MATKQTVECEEFYDLCQAYRHAPLAPQDGVVAAFQALVEYIDEYVVEQELELLELVKDMIADWRSRQ